MTTKRTHDEARMQRQAVRASLQIAKQCFAFLESEFCYVMQSSRSDSAGWELRYVGKNEIGVRIVDERREDLILILIYRLDAGKMVENESPISGTSCIRCIDFNDTLAPAQRIRPGYFYGNHSPYHDPKLGNERYIRDASICLRTYGRDLLDGAPEKFDVAAAALRARAATSQ